jgi:hypothetical protein
MGSCFTVNEAAMVTLVSLNLSRIHMTISKNHYLSTSGTSSKAVQREWPADGCSFIQGDQKVSVHLMITVQKTRKNISNRIIYHDNVVRIRDNRCRLCESNVPLALAVGCQAVRLTLWTLLVTFCIVIIRCTETFDHPVFLLCVTTVTWIWVANCEMLCYTSDTYSRSTEIYIITL